MYIIRPCPVGIFDQLFWGLQATGYVEYFLLIGERQVFILHQLQFCEEGRLQCFRIFELRLVYWKVGYLTFDNFLDSGG